MTTCDGATGLIIFGAINLQSLVHFEEDSLFFMDTQPDFFPTVDSYSIGSSEDGNKKIVPEK